MENFHKIGVDTKKKVFWSRTEKLDIHKDRRQSFQDHHWSISLTHWSINDDDARCFATCSAAAFAFPPSAEIEPAEATRVRKLMALRLPPRRQVPSEEERCRAQPQLRWYGRRQISPSKAPMHPSKTSCCSRSACSAAATPIDLQLDSHADDDLFFFQFVNL